MLKVCHTLFVLYISLLMTYNTIISLGAMLIVVLTSTYELAKLCWAVAQLGLIGTGLSQLKVAQVMSLQLGGRPKERPAHKLEPNSETSAPFDVSDI